MTKNSSINILSNFITVVRRGLHTLTSIVDFCMLKTLYKEHAITIKNIKA